MNVLLNEEDFRELTTGKVIDKGGVKIALADIGYELMIDILQEHYATMIQKYRADRAKANE